MRLQVLLIALLLGTTAVAAQAPADSAAVPAWDTEAGMQQVHRWFSVECFNACWDLIVKPDRSAADVEEMLLLADTSLWHWKQRADCTPVNLSVGYWQASRVHALAGQCEAARAFGEACMQVGIEQVLAPFYLGYACEALARAALCAQDSVSAQGYLRQADTHLAQVKDGEEAALLRTDLEELTRSFAGGR